MDDFLTASGFSDEEPPGIILRGIVVNGHAKALQRRDGSGIVVKITHAMQTGDTLAFIEEFVNPAEDTRVTLDGMEVKSWPKLPKFGRVDYIVERFRTDDGKWMVATQGRILRIKASPEEVPGAA